MTAQAGLLDRLVWSRLALKRDPLWYLVAALRSDRDGSLGLNLTQDRVSWKGDPESQDLTGLFFIDLTSISHRVLAP